MTSITAQQVKEDYLACLKQHNNDAEKCREVAKLYLECRMDRCGQHHDKPRVSCVWVGRARLNFHALRRAGISWPNRT